MTILEPLAVIIEALDRAGVPHMLVGSFASSHQGTPRSTQDIDLVIDPTPSQLDGLLRVLDPDRWYVPIAHARDELAARGQFNVIDGSTGWKVDLIVRKDRPFSIAEFGRRRPAVIGGVQVFVCSPEDTILSKLEWAELGDSSRQQMDASSVYRIQGRNLDEAYLERWAAELGLADRLTVARAEAGD